MQRLSLDGSWEMRPLGKKGWVAANVPGCNYSDLLAAGQIDDPFRGDNECKDLWISETDWEYHKNFTIDPSFLNEHSVVLCCEQLDTVCSVFVNGHLVGRGENAHRMYEFEVKPYLKAGENDIRIIFYSPIAYTAEKHYKDKMPEAVNSDVDGIPHIRKPQCHFGWDWGPKLPVSGITRPISLAAYRESRLQDVRISQIHAKGLVEVSVDCCVQGESSQPLAVAVTLCHPDGHRQTKTVPVTHREVVTFRVHNPQLWWTKELSGKDTQPLYQVEVALLQNDLDIDRAEKRIGLRTITLDRKQDQWGSNFRFVLNGVPIFAKGADWIPADSFINRFTQEQTDYFIRSVRDSNMNMLRVWGGGYYESDIFYDKCDVYGILVWQDFLFACAPYPFYEEAFLRNVKAEIRDNVRRLRHHASLTVWCGNNEIESMAHLWSSYEKLKQWTEQFFYHILPDELQRHDNVTPYIPGSPVGNSYMHSVDSDDQGDTHLWQVWHGLKPLTYYRCRYTRFCSEFGLESFPDLRTLREYIRPEDWSLNSDVMMVHQKCKNGNNKMLYYMASRFRIMKDFGDIVTLTQIIQSEGVRDATEHWRRNRGRCNGSLWWQLNDCWPTGSWASMDYKGRYKVLQYAAKHFFAPVMVSLEDTREHVDIYLINDLTKSFEGSLRWRAVRFDGTLIHEEALDKVAISALSAKRKARLNLSAFLTHADRKNSFLQVDLMNRAGQLVSRKIALFAKENQINLPKAAIDVHTEIKDGLAVIRLRCAVFARFVGLALPSGFQPFSDNYFDLLPGEEKTVTVPVDSDMTAGQMAQELRVRSLSDMEPAGTRLSDQKTRAKILMVPGYKA